MHPAVQPQPQPVVEKPAPKVLNAPAPTHIFKLAPPKPVVSPDVVPVDESCLDDLLSTFETSMFVAPPEPQPEEKGPVEVHKDLHNFWHEFIKTLCDMTTLDKNTSNAISMKHVALIEKAAEPVVTRVKDPENVERMKPSMQKVKLTEAFEVIPVRIGKLRECVRMMGFDQANHVNILRAVLPMVGSVYWLYLVNVQVNDDEMLKEIAQVAVSCRTIMTAINSNSPLPRGILFNVVKLMQTVSHKIFEIKDPQGCKKLSDATNNVGKTLKSLILVPMLASSGSPMDISSLAKTVAEQLGIIKNTLNGLQTSKLGPELSKQDELEIYTTAHKQLKMALDFYLSNAEAVPLPYPHQIIPLINKQLEVLTQLPKLISSPSVNVKLFNTCVTTLASSASKIRDVFLLHKSDFEDDTESWEQLQATLNAGMDFASQLFIAGACFMINNQICTRGQLAYAARGMTFCTAVVVDFFCLDL